MNLFAKLMLSKYLMGKSRVNDDNINRLQTLQVQEEHLVEITKNYKYDLHIPVILGLENDDLSREIEQDIDKDVNQFINELKNVANEYIMLSTPYTLESSYEIYYQDEDIVSFCILFSNYYGGAHGMTYKICYNYDIRSGKRLSLRNLFKGEEYQEKINAVIEEEIKKRNEIEGYKVINGFKGIKENQHFYIKDGLLVIYFDLYEIAPYVAGIIEFTMPQELFSVNDYQYQA